MSRLDSAIEWFSPEWGARRAAARASLRDMAETRKTLRQRERAALTGYREGALTTRDVTPQSRGASADWTLELGFDRRNIVDLARQLERVNSIASSVLDRACEHVIGEGFTLKCKTGDKGWNTAAEEYWREWCLRADSRKMMTWNEMLTVAFRSWLRDGDFLFVLERDGTARMVESDEIASKVGGYYKPTDADGVEMDKRGRIKSFYVFDYDPETLWPDRRTALPRLVKVPAEHTIFLARRVRANQARGLSAFAGASWIFESADDCLESVAVAHHMAAAAGLVVYKKNAIPGVKMGSQNVLKMAPGKVMRLEPGEEVQQIQPQHPGDTFQVLMHYLTRIAAARFGMSLELVNYDFTDANYSNMRAQSLETAVACRIKQRGMITHACSQMWAWVCANAIRQGELSARKDAWKHSWGVPGKAWQDPEVELRSNMGAVDGCLGTRRHILAQLGYDFDEVLDELADEEKKIKAKGLTVYRSSLTREDKPEQTAKDFNGEPSRTSAALRADGGPSTTVINNVMPEQKPPTSVFSPSINIQRPETPQVHVYNKVPVEVKNQYAMTMPELQVDNNLEVNVDAEIKGADKKITVNRDGNGRIVSAESVGAD